MDFIPRKSTNAINTIFPNFEQQICTVRLIVINMVLCIAHEPMLKFGCPNDESTWLVSVDDFQASLFFVTDVKRKTTTNAPVPFCMIIEDHVSDLTFVFHLNTFGVKYSQYSKLCWLK